jgi:hypothetical protein
VNPIFNKYEEVTCFKLRKLTEQNGAHVFAKVRAADVCPISNSGLSDADYSFALKAHFDFVVTDRSFTPLFGVEFDGPLHRANPQKQRDRRKDTICERFGFSLLRINSKYLDRQFRGLDLLTYFVDVWFMSTAFDEAQARGDVPYDADFDPAFIISDPERKERFPYWISVDLQVRLQKLATSGRIHDYVPSHWIGIDTNGNYRCLAWLGFTEHSYIIVETGMHAQRFPVVIPDILSQLAIFDLWEELDRVLSGSSDPESRHVLDELLRFYAHNFKR